MIDNLRPLTFPHLMKWIINEQKKSGSIFGVRDFYQANQFKTLNVYGEKMETPFGPASGPHTQYAQSIIAAYAAGCRFFELRTVCPRHLEQDPEIAAGSEGYNVEGAANLTFEESYIEYCKAYVALKVLAVEYEMGGMDGFIFNISAGYTYEDFSSSEMSVFFEKMLDATKSRTFKECLDWLRDNIDLFENFTLDDIDDISPRISGSVSVCTPLDCSIKELESIAKYLMIERKMDIGIKINATLLGYEYCRNTLDSMGYYDIEINKEAVEKSVRYYDMIPLINKLLGIANKENRLFGVKLTGSFPVISKGERSRELKLSGKALFPLSVALAARISEDFDGRLRIGFSGGADANNVEDIFEAGVWPITMNTTILKPGGYNRFKQFSYTFNEWSYSDFYGTRTGLLRRMAERVKLNNYYTKPLKSDILIRRKGRIPLTDCFIAPCVEGCPIGQDITGYLSLIDEEKYTQALKVIMKNNPLPFTTGSICTHECMSNCTRIYYEKSVKIREAKLIAAQNGYEGVLEELHPELPVGRKLNVAVIGGGPAGMATAFFLAREGHKVTIFCEQPLLGGAVRHLIPDFRIPAERVDRDAALLKKLNVEIRREHKVELLSELEDFDKTVVAIGAPTMARSNPKAYEAEPAICFLVDYNKTKGKLDIKGNVVVVGGSNITIDTARAAKRVKGVENVYIVYRRSRQYMLANDAELQVALSEGIELIECMNPYAYENGYLKCHVTELRDKGDDGRRIPYDTEEIMSIPADYIIRATELAVDTDFYIRNNIKVDEEGMPVLDPDTFESSIPNVFVVGDARHGTSSVVDVIADARKVCDAILKEFKDMVSVNPAAEYAGVGYGGGVSYHNLKAMEERRIAGRRSSDNRLSGLYARKGILREPHYRNDGGRCLDCAKLCENCVDVCPNRANVEIKVPGNLVPQVVHLDRLCNECGNCDTFCPYEGAPYREKFTLYDTLDDFNAGENEGLVFTHDGSAFTIRLRKKRRKIDNLGNTISTDEKESVTVFSVSRIEAAEFNGINTDLCNLIATLYEHYKYLIM
ncbi:MAG: putative selenate reductase subunit YgfK [Lachnospiraceae bacterium]|nr:putative selenate reductase subunit YgfK [Lachnospiraceae bacterium]